MNKPAISRKNTSISIPTMKAKSEPFGKQMFPGISSQTSQQLLQIADLIHIRFADVLLMQSELRQDATGLNKVRAAPTWLRWPTPWKPSSRNAAGNLHSSPSAGGISFAGRVLRFKETGDILEQTDRVQYNKCRYGGTDGKIRL